jgi:hypothetical protein
MHTLVLGGSNGIAAKFFCLMRSHAQDFGEGEQP